MAFRKHTGKHGARARGESRAANFKLRPHQTSARGQFPHAVGRHGAPFAGYPHYQRNPVPTMKAYYSTSPAHAIYRIEAHTAFVVLARLRSRSSRRASSIAILIGQP